MKMISILQCLQNLKWPPGSPKMLERVWNGVYLHVFGRSSQPSKSHFFSSSSMRKVDNIENGGKGGGEKIMKKKVTTTLLPVDRLTAISPLVPIWHCNVFHIDKFNLFSMNCRIILIE